MIQKISSLTDANLIALGSVLVVIFTFATGTFMSIRKRRRTRAFEFIAQITTSEPLATESQNLYDLLEKFHNKKPSLQDLSSKELRTVLTVCSFYEFLGLSILQKLLNREVILLARYAAMEQTWNTFELVIKERRAALDREHLFGSFQKSVEDFKKQYLKLQNRRYP